jgi:hypothetical protein
MGWGALTVLHLIPMRMADPAFRFDLRELHKRRVALPPLYASGWDSRYNLDGFVAWSPGIGQRTSYVQVFRHGALEAVDSGMLDPQGTQRVIPGSLLADQLLENIPKYLDVQRQLGVDPPIVLLLTLMGVEGYRLAASRAWDRSARLRESQSTPLDRDLIPSTESIMDEWGVDVPLLLRPPLDAVWNAAGHPECSFYDTSGQWIGG